MNIQNSNQGLNKLYEEKPYELISIKECSRSSRRMISLDTESTDLDFKSGARLTEVGCVEIIDNKITGRFFQSYINPCANMSAGAYRITRLTNEFLRDKPLFAEIADDLLKFIGEDVLIIHNAKFDVPFLNYELARAGRPQLNCKVLDTLIVAREMFPGKPCNLDAVCTRLNIDNSSRTFHGALLDAQILSKVYFGLTNLVKQQKTIDIFLEEDLDLAKEETKSTSKSFTLKREEISSKIVSEEEILLHKNFFAGK